MTLKEIAIAEIDRIAKVVYSPEHATLSVVLCNNRKFFIKVTENRWSVTTPIELVHASNKFANPYI